MDSQYQIRVSNLSWQAKEDEIKDFFNTFTKVTSIKLVLDYKKRSKGFAYITLADENSLNEALNNVERTHFERKLKIIRAKPLSEKTQTDNQPQLQQKKKPINTKQNQKDQIQNSSRKNSEQQTKIRVKYEPKHDDQASIYVGNLSYRITEMKLGRHFEQYGDIKNVRIIEDRETQKSRGFGYIEFELKESVEKALAEDGQQFEGRTIKVSKVQKKENKQKTQYEKNDTQVQI